MWCLHLHGFDGKTSMHAPLSADCCVLAFVLISLPWFWRPSFQKYENHLQNNDGIQHVQARGSCSQF